MTFLAKVRFSYERGANFRIPGFPVPVRESLSVTFSYAIPARGIPAGGTTAREHHTPSRARGTVADLLLFIYVFTLCYFMFIIIIMIIIVVVVVVIVVGCTPSLTIIGCTPPQNISRIRRGIRLLTLKGHYSRHKQRICMIKSED